MEYGEFSKGAATISELDFARILLRYTFLNTEDYDKILDSWDSEYRIFLVSNS